jgi:hypothetical protein
MPSEKIKNVTKRVKTTPSRFAESLVACGAAEATMPLLL